MYHYTTSGSYYRVGCSIIARILIQKSSSNLYLSYTYLLYKKTPLYTILLNVPGSRHVPLRLDNEHKVSKTKRSKKHLREGDIVCLNGVLHYICAGPPSRMACCRMYVGVLERRVASFFTPTSQNQPQVTSSPVFFSGK